MWGNMMIGKIFSKTMNGSTSRSASGKGGKSDPKTTNHCPLVTEVI